MAFASRCNLEMRPSRKRRRQIVSDDPDDDIYVPFSDDFPGNLHQDEQAPFVDVSHDVAENGHGSGGVAASPPVPSPDSLLDEFNGTNATTTVPALPPGLAPILEQEPELQQVLPMEDSEDELVPTSPADTLSPLSGQPEREVSPVIPGEQHPGIEGPSADPSPEPPLQEPPEGEPFPVENAVPVTPLTQALRHNAERLDGISPPRNSSANFVEQPKSQKQFAF